MRSSQADDIRKANKEAQMEARRAAAAEQIDQEAKQAHAESAEIHSDSDIDEHTKAGDDILRQEQQFNRDTAAPVDAANVNQLRQEQLFRQGMQQQAPSAACP